MKRLLKIEFTKLMSNRSSKLLVFAYFGLLLSLAFLCLVKLNLGFITFDFVEQGLFEFPLIWHVNTYVASYLKIFLAIVIISMISSEYSYKTLKQNLIDGLSKQEFLNSKFYMILALSLISTVFVALLSLILGSVYSIDTSIKSILSDIMFIPAFFVELVGFFTICMFLGFLIKRSAFALGFLILLYISEVVLNGVLSLSSMSYDTKHLVLDLLPMNAIGDLIISPFSRLEVVQDIRNNIGDKAVIDYHVPIKSMAITIFWTVICYFMSLNLLKKRDL